MNDCLKLNDINCHFTRLERTCLSACVLLLVALLSPVLLLAGDKCYKVSPLITPPFWEQNWFIFLLGLVLAYVLFWWFHKRRKKNAERRHLQVESKVEARTREITDYYKELEHITNEKDNFIQMVAHDLKNPLTGILFSADMLEEEIQKINNAEAEEYLKIIKNAAERMKDLITKLLDMNLLERGKMRVQIEEISAEKVCRQVYLDYWHKAKEKNIEMHYHNEVPSAIIKADQLALTQIMDNLISNAVKYTFQGKNIYENLRQLGNKLCVVVKDEGPGLSEDDKSKLFAKFTVLSAKPTGGEQSTGVGLYIIKKLADLIGADVRFESQLGQGCSFFVELPLA